MVMGRDFNPSSSLSRWFIINNKNIYPGLECWICYDTDNETFGALIQPCACKGDVSMVHHDCLRRWLVESADNPDSLICKVCKQVIFFSLASKPINIRWIKTGSRPY